MIPLQVKQTTTKFKVSGLANGDSIVSYTSSNPKVFTVNKNGKIKAGKKKDHAVLTITLKSGLKKTVKVNVQKTAVKTKKIQGLSKTLTLKKGSSVKLKPVLKVNVSSITLKTRQQTSGLKVTVAKGDKVTSWKSANTKIVKVSGSGKLTAQNKTGTTTVTVKLKSGLSKKIKVKVQSSTVKTTRISGLPKTITLKKGKTTILKPVLAPFTAGEKITYMSSDKKKVSVSTRGVVKGLKSGKVRVTVKSGKQKLVIIVIVK